MPTNDWQFWVVSACFVLAALYLLRGVIPGLRGRAKKAKQTKRVNLTVGGKSVSKDER